MTKPVPWIIGIIGIVFICIIGIVFIGVAWFTGSRPPAAFRASCPGFEAGSDHFHLTHALGSLIVALVLFAIAIIWFQLISERLAFETAGRERSSPVRRLGKLVSGPLRSEDQTQKLEPAVVAKPSRTVLTDVVRHADAGTVRAWT